MTLAISGPSGTGKSTIVSIIKNCLATANPGLKVATIGGDSFFIGPKPDSYWTQAPKESPDSVDMIALRTAVAAATSDDAGNDLLLLEGFLLIQDAPLMLYVDAVLFLNCDPAVCLQRRLARSERSDHEAEGLKVYFAKHVWPGYLQHTAPAIAKLRATVAAAVIPDARPRLFEIDGTLPLDEVTTLAVNALPTLLDERFACEKNAQPALFSSRAAFEPPEEGSKKTSVVAAAQGGGFVYGPEHHTSA